MGQLKKRELKTKHRQKAGVENAKAENVARARSVVDMFIKSYTVRNLKFVM